MKHLRLILLILSIVSAGKISNAQNGFLITQSGQKIIGYLRHEVNFVTGQKEIELWKTKKDPSPKRFKTSSLKEYKIDKEHIKIFDTFYPFENQDIAFADLKVKVITMGKVNLYSSEEIESPEGNIPIVIIGVGGIPAMHGGGSNAITTYILDNNKGLVQAIDRKNIKQDLSNFLADNDVIISEFFSRKKVKYKNIEKLVERYNQVD